MTKIAFLSTMADSPWGGSEELWARTALEAINQGHSVLVSTYNWGSLPLKVEQLRKNGAEVILRDLYRPSLKYRIKKRAEIIFSLTEFDKILKFSPEVICISQGGTYDITYSKEVQKLLNKLGKPYCLISQQNLEYGVLNENLYRLTRKIFMEAKKVFFVSERNRAIAKRQLCLNLENSSVVYNPINTLQREPLPFATSVVVQMASVARLDCNFKGQDILFEILSTDKWKKRDWRLNLYGRGPHEDYLKELATFYGLKERINFKGFATDIIDVWNSNHILIMPSIAEGTPLALMEALICGRPAVVTDVGGNSELIIEGKNGFIAESASVKYIDEALDRAWLVKKEWREIGVKGFEILKSKVDFFPERKLLSQLIQ